MSELCSDPGVDPPSPNTDSVPRVRCLGSSRSHEPVFLTIRTASPLVLECPICRCRLEVRPVDADGKDDPLISTCIWFTPQFATVQHCRVPPTPNHRINCSPRRTMLLSTHIVIELENRDPSENVPHTTGG